jgi:hypothetical protein
MNSAASAAVTSLGERTTNANCAAGRGCSNPVKLSLDAKELPPGSGRGNLSSRLVFAGEKWQARDLCIHGQELKWHCAECEGHFKEGEKQPVARAPLMFARGSTIANSRSEFCR